MNPLRLALPSDIPSPSRGVFHLGPLPLRMYALCILLGVLVAVWVGNRRYVARGGQAGFVAEMATIAVPAGLVGARLYHVVTSPAAYFGKHGHPIEALYIWRGGLGIWGGVLAGALAAYVLCRRRGVSFAVLADAVGPCVALAQALGRFGNYFNQELYGRVTSLPWALRIDRAHWPDTSTYANISYDRKFLTFHPTFLYEALWDVGVFGFCVWADRRFRLRRGQVFVLYIAAYTVGRAWVEALRIDPANKVFGVRLNDLTSVVVFLAATAAFVWLGRRPLPEPDESGVGQAVDVA